ncbi:RBBP9/YdeN family alpha/beta hydrolase [Haladaptatus caseinilyticus]|uniref:RBBP9/YdeN family alpha/beta hydrolase n=1 Tax=Haladaptatus caseinilyticus TaxID=2993314 RepID=UPI00224B7DE0|nr:alpha/beta fold hydrolase [Haladaptatus caseinilyticus]
MKKHVLFIHGAGEGAYEEDEKLAVSLQDKLGAAYDVRFPRMPNEARPTYTEWKHQIDEELAAVTGEVVLVGHSLGGSVLLKYLSEEGVRSTIVGVYLIAAPYWGVEDWQSSELELHRDVASELASGLPVFLYHSRDDEWVPFSHLEVYRELLPQATVREFDGRGHQFDNDLSSVARDIKR